jgi:hypothetical protein
VFFHNDVSNARREESSHPTRAISMHKQAVRVRGQEEPPCLAGAWLEGLQ